MEPIQPLKAVFLVQTEKQKLIEGVLCFSIYLSLPDFLRKGPWGYFLVVLFAVGLFCQAVESESESDERDIRSVRM